MRFALFKMLLDYLKQKNAARPENVRVREAAVKARLDTQLAADLAKAVVLLTREREITLEQIKDAQQNWKLFNPTTLHAIAILQEYDDAMKATLMAVNAAAANPNPMLDMIIVRKCCDWVHESAAKVSTACNATEQSPI